MDNGCEGTSWLGNIIQKFDDIFLEVDDAVRQELTSVTNQLQNVVKFWLDLVEEEPPLSLENTEEEADSEIDEDHCEKESGNENHLHCTSSVEHMDVIQSDQYVDTRVYEKSKMIENENLVKEKLSQHEMSVLVSPKEEESNNLEEDKQLQQEMTDVVSPKEEEINNIEDVSSYISSPAPPSYSDYSSKSCESLVLGVEVTPADASILDVEVTLADASTESPDDSITEGISHNEEDCPHNQMFEKIKIEDHLSGPLLEKDPEYEEDYLEAELMAVSGRQQARISYLRRVQLHYSMMKTIMQNLFGIVRSSRITTQKHDESCDSDWVIITE